MLWERKEVLEIFNRPLLSVREYCQWCMNNQPNEIKLCTSHTCPLYPYRFGYKPKPSDTIILQPVTGTPEDTYVTRGEAHAPDPIAKVIKSIRIRCIDCCGHQLSRVSGCEEAECPLHPFRMGRNPNRAGIGGNLVLVKWLLSPCRVSSMDIDLSVWVMLLCHSRRKLHRELS